ncbi:MAG: GNAT family N-acetyltransferase, partial [Solibacillus sp.]|uniref:GNAT family N-acetyltransferase n=1 Tax=Solibacillus sp. TaxID=1909654 RepID=UPI003314F903
DIPPLKDTVETLQNCGEIFFGYFLDDQLCGVVSVKEDKDEIDIHRLIVHPTHFRKGIAQELLNFISSKSNVGILKVATGSNNTPAVRFYEKNGFEKVKEVRVNPKITLSYFEKNV